VTPATTYILIRHIDDDRRTDGSSSTTSIRLFSAIRLVIRSRPTATALRCAAFRCTPTMNSLASNLGREKPGEDQRQIIKGKRTGSREGADEINREKYGARGASPSRPRRYLD
jgi:hypothetical protein